jgi:teichuronic acid biosynthesis protein TuaE
MPVVTLHNTVRDAFFRWGWLLPAVLPLTQIGGRALFNVFAGIYALWGLLSFWNRRKRLDHATTLLYLALLGFFLLGIPGSVDPKGALRLWVNFAALSFSMLLMQVALQESPAHLDRLLKALALFGASALGGLYLLLPYHWLEGSGQPFNPLAQLRQDNLPFLLPFLLGWLWWYGRPRWRYGLMAGVIIAMLAYVVIAEGRAALLGLIVGLATFCGLGLGWRLRWAALLAVLVLVIGIVANTGPFRKADLDPDRPLDAFTAGRTILWRQALEHPPERPWLGVGIGNGHHAETVLTFDLGGHSLQVKHLHNFLLDAWYETGILGVGLLLALIGAVLARVARCWPRLSDLDRQRTGVLLAAALVIMTAASLSFSYTSRHFACYLFVCLGGLIHLSRSCPTAATSLTTDHRVPDKH